MGWVKLQDSTLTSIAGSIRNKLGVQTQYLPSAMPAAIDSIPTGGGGVLDKTVTFVVDGVDYAVYSVPAGKSIFEPAPPTKSGFYFAGWGTTSSASSFRTFPYTPTLSEETLYANWIAGTLKISTVAGLGSSSTSAVTIVTDTGFPSSFEEWTDARGNVFVKIPTMYRKIVTVVSNQITSFIMSTIKRDDDYHPYSCFVAPDGETVLPYVCIGKYCSSSIDECNSVDATPLAQTLDTGRINARAVGTGYQLYDWQLQKLFQDLSLINYGEVNFNSGRLIESYLGISHLNYDIFIDGVRWHNATSPKWLFAKNPAHYVTNPSTTSTGYSLSSFTVAKSNGYIYEMGYDTNENFFNYSHNHTGSATTYYTDYFSYGNNGIVVSNVGAASASNGLWHTSASKSLSDTCYARLCYRPTSA